MKESMIDCYKDLEFGTGLRGNHGDRTNRDEYLYGFPSVEGICCLSEGELGGMQGVRGERKASGVVIAYDSRLKSQDLPAYRQRYFAASDSRSTCFGIGTDTHAFLRSSLPGMRWRCDDNSQP